MNKELKRNILFAIFTCAVLIVLASFLVVKIFANPQNSDEIYATKFDLVCPRDINVNVNTEIKFKKLLKITPYNYNQDIDYEISPNNFCTFDLNTNTFKATKVGSFYIKFKAKFSNKSYKTQTLKLTVKPESEFLDIKQVKENINVGQTFQFADAFEIVNECSYSISVEDNSILCFKNNIFTANKVGNTNIILTIDRDYLTYDIIFSFDVTNNFMPDDEKTNPNENDNQNENNPGSEVEDNKPSIPDEQEKPPVDKGDEGNLDDKDNETENNQDVNDNKDENKDDGKPDNNDKNDENVKPTYKIVFKQNDIILDENNINLNLGNNSIEFWLFENDILAENQVVDVEILENDGCVEGNIQALAPLIYFNAVKQGRFKLKITYSLDPSITFIVDFTIN